MAVALFDLDGTLTDPKVGITRSVAYALHRFGIEIIDLDTLIAFIGPPLRQSFQLLSGLSEADATTAVEAYREYFSETGIYENAVYEGIETALDDLLAEDWVLAVATSKPTVFAERVLEHFALRSRFCVVAGAELNGTRSTKAEVIEDALAQLALAPGPETVMVGDREHDMIGAKQVGLSALGVTWGYGSRDELLGSGADAVVTAVGELAAAVRSTHNTGQES